MGILSVLKGNLLPNIFFKAILNFVYFQAIVETMRRLTQEVSIKSFVANELLLPVPKEEISGMLRKQEDAHFMSIQLNLFNTFLYMVINLFLLTMSPHLSYLTYFV